jgi:hypothetical protein
MNRKSAFVLFLIPLVFMTAGGCASKSMPKPPAAATPIAEIQKHPRDWVGKEVLISGEVKETFSVIIHKQFVLKDATGEITVVTSKPLPAKGEQLSIHGVVDEGLSVGSETKTIVREKEG